jgi:2-phospho-L-lactate guanylyltransferase (CobY/MobA/RfbA family)
VAAAAAAGAVHRLEHAPSLAHDVDTPEDLVALMGVLDGTRTGAQRTRGALMQLERSGALAGLRDSSGAVG